MSKSAKNRALRLLLYLRSAGQTPELRAANYYELAARLYKQYVELPPEMRRNSRYLGRKIIRACGLRAAYQPADGVTPFKPMLNPRAKCSICRVENLNKPKSVWPTKEDAEEFCRYFVRFAPYPCPVGNRWHVAHRKRQSISE